MSDKNALAGRLSAYFQLVKPQLCASVLMTTVVGYYLSCRGSLNELRLIFLLLGAGAACCGSSVLNQYLEKDYDARMEYAKDRPIPAGRIPPVRALNFGIILVLSGLLVLYLGVNLLTAFLSLLSSFLYVVIYTPLKRVSWLNTSLGAIAGALPPVGGWAAANGKIGWGAGILFILLFVWQHPHFYSIAWVRRDDYRRAGFKMLSTAAGAKPAIFRHILFFSLILIPLSVLPVSFNFRGSPWAWVCIFLAMVPAALSLKLLRSGSVNDSRALFKASLAYLPALLSVIVLAGAF